MIYLIVTAACWIIAQSIKYIINSYKTRDFKNTKPFHDSGRMPSAHTATTVGLAVIIGLLQGFDSAIFALAALLAFVTMYDAVKVRRAVGEQGTLLQRLVAKVVLPDVKLRVAEGHRPIEVLVGALIGVVVATLTYMLAK